MTSFTRTNFLSTGDSYEISRIRFALFEKESVMSYQNESYQFLKETRQEIDRLTRRIDSLKKVEQLLDGMLSGNAPVDQEPTPRSGRPEKSPETDPEISALPLFSGSRRSEPQYGDHRDQADTASSMPFKEPRSEDQKKQISKIPSEQNSPSGSDFSQASGSWGELALLALRSSPDPMSLDELVSLVSKMEGCPPSNDPRNAIRVALTRRKEDVRREGRGFYQLRER